jgi:hypothetical protein
MEARECPARIKIMRLDDQAGWPPAARAALAMRHETLEQVTRWAFAQRPPLRLVEVVTQDEFTHDVVIALDDSLHLVYDTT